MRPRRTLKEDLFYLWVEDSAGKFSVLMPDRLNFGDRASADAEAIERRARFGLNYVAAGADGPPGKELGARGE